MHPLRISLILLASLASAAADSDFTIDGRPYRLITTARTWDAAEADAVSKGGHLVHIDDQTESDRLLTALQGLGVATTATDGGGAVYVWIGGKESAEGNYAWADVPAADFWTGGKNGASSAGAFANWGRNNAGGGGPEPDNFNSTQNRTAMALQAWPVSGTQKIGQPGQWNDVSGANALAYVIEFDGMWATFRMSHGGTPKGTFTAKLFPDKAPLAVANFAGLAEGTRPFIDEKNGKIALRPFYNGLICHRVISGFMIQGGCPRGNGTGGPGYDFPDEFDNTLRHTKGGMLSMANSGPMTNGSQFFVTVAATQHLDDKHTIFGEVVDGYATVVQPLNAVTTASDKPVQDVVIEQVTISRSGTAARQLSGNPASLPALSLIQPTAALDASRHCLLHFPRQAHRTWNLLRTADLNTWTMNEGVLLDGQTPGTAPLDTFDFTTAGSARQYYRVAELSYPGPIFAPPDVTARRIVITSADFINTIDLTAARTGKYSLALTGGTNPLTGNVVDYAWERNPWGSRLICLIDNTLSFGATRIYFFDHGLRFTGVAGGTLHAQFQDGNRSDLLKYSGTFSVGAIP